MTEKGERQGEVPARLRWEPMTLTKVGAFSDVLRGGSTGTPDAGSGTHSIP
jgi:hypothetical protein